MSGDETKNAFGEEVDCDEPSSVTRHKIDKLEKLLTAKCEAIDALESYNEKLEQKLLSAEASIEDLRLQVRSLELKFAQNSIQRDCEKESRACQTSDDVDYRHDMEAKGAASALVDDVTKAAHEIAREQFLEGMAYEKTSGLYYDYKSGYYYDADRSLFYDASSQTYYAFNYETSTYEIHSQGIPRDASKSPTEDGELSSSDNEISLKETNEEEEESTFPCVRMMVAESSSVRAGTLFLLTYAGGTVGREGNHEVLLCDEMGCSKNHASISFCENSYKFFIRDLCSTNGTYLNDKRLPTDGGPFEIGHGSRIVIGTTHLTCHVHPGHETCLECEPGVVQIKQSSSNQPLEGGNKRKKENMRRKEMKRLRSKYGMKYGHKDVDTGERNYKDRAEDRRCQVGSDNPYEKTHAADLNVAIERKNKGFEMLSKMGWKEGEGLGCDTNKGIAEPVQVELKTRFAGLAAASCHSADLVNLKTKQKIELSLKTRKRYAEVGEKNEGE